MSEVVITDKTLYPGAPADLTGRLPVEIATYRLLDSLSIPYDRLDHPPLFTIDACREADALLGVAMCKNLFLSNRTETDFYLLMMPGDKRFSTKEFSSLIGSSRLSFAKPAYMEEFLGITPGSVSVLGLMNDTDRRVRLFVDGEVLRAPYIGCHPCINTSSLRLRTRDLLEVFLPAVRHSFETVELIGG